MKKSIIIVVILAIIIIILLVVLLLPQNVQSPTQNNNNQPPADIEVFSPKAGDAVSSPLKISGIVRGNGWSGFEGQVGIVKLFNSSSKELAMGILTANGEWMQQVINFETVLWFDYPGGGTGKLVFYNENPSGEAERDKTFELPIKLQKSSSEKTTFNIYFGYPHDLEQSCDLVFPFKREVPKTQSVAKLALEELLRGPSDQEIYAGYVTSINKGVKVQNLVIENGIAKVDFSEELDKNVAGSCRVMAVRSQIEQTLKQFPTVKSVVISINGKTEGILQP